MTERATSTLSAILIEDEQLAREELSYLLREFPDVEVLATGRNGLEAVKLIENLEPDVVFLDVQMPGLDGFGVIQKLREKNGRCRISSWRRLTTNMPSRRSAGRRWIIC